MTTATFMVEGRNEMSVLIEEIEAVARRVYRQEKEHEQASHPHGAESTVLDK